MRVVGWTLGAEHRRVRIALDYTLQSETDCDELVVTGPNPQPGMGGTGARSAVRQAARCLESVQPGWATAAASRQSTARGVRRTRGPAPPRTSSRPPAVRVVRGVRRLLPFHAARRVQRPPGQPVRSGRAHVAGDAPEVVGAGEVEHRHVVAACEHPPLRGSGCARGLRRGGGLGRGGRFRFGWLRRAGLPRAVLRAFSAGVGRVDLVLERGELGLERRPGPAGCCPARPRRPAGVGRRGPRAPG